MKILVTGSAGFLGRHLCEGLTRMGLEYVPLEAGHGEEEFAQALSSCDYVFHLAGVNRPGDVNEYYEGNYGFTKKIIDALIEAHHFIPIVFASSTQAERDNDYGKSKKMAEDALFASGLPCYVYRLSNVYGEGARPNYNSVVATFCHNLAHGLPLEVIEPEKHIAFHYVEDVCDEFLGVLVHEPEGKKKILSVSKTHECSVGHLAELLTSFKEAVESDAHLPLLHGEFEFTLFKTLLSYLSDPSMPLNASYDHRGYFKELYRSKTHGQISDNMAYPMVIKGGHYHARKREIFFTVIGEAEIKQKDLHTGELIVDRVSGENPRLVPIHLRCVHQIQNVGRIPSHTLMWVSEPYNPEDTDTFPAPLL